MRLRKRPQWSALRFWRVPPDWRHVVFDRLLHRHIGEAVQRAGNVRGDRVAVLGGVERSNHPALQGHGAADRDLRPPPGRGQRQRHAERRGGDRLPVWADGLRRLDMHPGAEPRPRLSHKKEESRRPAGPGQRPGEGADVGYEAWSESFMQRMDARFGLRTVATLVASLWLCITACLAGGFCTQLKKPMHANSAFA